MAVLPTVKLRDPAGKVRIVNEFDYARDMSDWMARGFRRVGETHGDATDEDVAFEVQQSDIERERRKTREAPKDFEQRKVEVRQPAAPQRSATRRTRTSSGSSGDA